MGSLTVTEIHDMDLDRKQLIVANLVPSSSYATGGEALAVTSFDKARVRKFLDVQANGSSGYTAEWDQANLKLKLFHAPGDYMALNSGAIVIGSASAAKVKVGATVAFLNAGLFKSQVSAEIAFTATTHDITAHASLVQERVYAVSLQADGTGILTAGVVASGAGTAAIPDVPDGETYIGYCRVAVAAGSTDFDASTDLLSAGHLTDTYVNATETGPREVKSGTDLSGVTFRAQVLLGQ